MCEKIFPVVSVGDAERDSVGQVLPVTIRLDPETWEALTEHLVDVYEFVVHDDVPPPALRDRIRSFLETVLIHEMAMWDHLAGEADGLADQDFGVRKSLRGFLIGTGNGVAKSGAVLSRVITNSQ